MASTDISVETFLTALASKDATPGGGSAAAVLGSVGAALTSMVCHLTIGKKKYATFDAELVDVLRAADDLRERLVAAVDEDVAAFDVVMQAYGLPKETEPQQMARRQAIQIALRQAIEAPLACARACRQVIDLAAIVSGIGNVAVISDAGVAVLAAYAGLRGSALNVYVNVKVLEDRGFAEAKQRELAALLADAGSKTETTYEAVKTRMN